MKNFPKYTNKADDGRCKLLTEDIERLKTLKKEGFTNDELGKMFNVSANAVRYWVNDEAHIKYIEYAKKRQKSVDRNYTIELKRKYRIKKRKFLREDVSLPGFLAS